MIVSVTQAIFQNGWCCPKCDCMTEHEEVKGQEICLECGHRLGKPSGYVKAKQREYFQRPEVKAKKREYFQRPEVKAKKREYSQRPDVKTKQREAIRRYLQRKKAKVEKLLENSKMEVVA